MSENLNVLPAMELWTSENQSTISIHLTYYVLIQYFVTFTFDS